MLNATITISTDEYEILLYNTKLLHALEAAGVDNWEGYEIALERIDEDATN